MAEPGKDLWRAILDPGWIPPVDTDTAGMAAAAVRLGAFLSPALAGHLLEPAGVKLGTALVPEDDVRQSLLLNRFTGGVQRRWMAEIAETGIPVVAMKGFALAHSHYPDPDLRTVGDLDLLVRGGDRDRLFDFLLGRGFEFEILPTGPWGFISDASYQPMVSAEGDCSIDVHVQPDCYPAYRSLTADRLFAAAGETVIDGTVHAIPSDAHALVLSLTNAAKDKFGPYSIRKVVDIALLLRSGAGIDWDEVARLARDGRFEGPASVSFALLGALGAPLDGVPPVFRSPPGGVRHAVFRALVADFDVQFAEEPGPMRVLARELLLCTEPSVAFHNALLRLRGLVSPRRGIPAGYRAGQ